MHELVAQVRKMRLGSQRKLFARLGMPGERRVNRTIDVLTDKQKMFVAEYTSHLNTQRAAEAAGISHGTAKAYLTTKRPEVLTVVHEKLAEREAESELTTEYVREYIKSVMDFCPGDYFQPGVNGGWMITREGYEQVPPHVRRLIEEMTLITYGEQTVLQVRFISKTAALAMAARFTLTQKFAGAIAALPWDKIAGELSSEAADAVERRLEQLKNGLGGAARPAEAG